MVKSITFLTIALLILTFGYVSGNEITNNNIFNTDSIAGTIAKVEKLIAISVKLDSINSSLSIDAVNQAYNLSAKINNRELMAQCNHQRGIILYKNNETYKALISLKNALEYYEKLNNPKITATILINIGEAYMADNQFAKSLIYYKSALTESSKTDDSLNIAICDIYLGQSNAHLGNNNKASMYFLSANGIAVRNNFYYYVADSYLKLSKIQILSGQIDSVSSQITRALEIAKNHHYNNLVSDALQLSANYYYTIGNKTEAEHEIRNFINFSDSINIIKTRELSGIITSLANGNLSDGNYISTRYILWTIILLLILLIVFFIYKLIHKTAQFKNKITTITSELDAYKVRCDDLEGAIEKKTKDRIVEIDEIIEENKLLKVALGDSLTKLVDVNNLKDIFLSKISREIRTPLSGILGFSEILETELALMEDPLLFEFANSISQSGASLVSLLNNILDISRLDSNDLDVEFKHFSTKELIQRIVDENYKIASLKGLKLIYSPKTAPDIYTDSRLFSKVISLILSNSIKFTEKGFIKISHYLDDSSGMIFILIKDTGIGIDKVYIDKVFEPFRQESLGYSTSYQGAGLGLPLAKKISAKLNGDINIESEKGSGTTVTISFPAFTKQELPSATGNKSKIDVKKQKEMLPWEKLSVLVVEDDNMNQILYRKLLQKARYLEIVRDGKTALAIVEKHLGDNRFQVVLMDINLPAPWDGISLMKEIRSVCPDYQQVPFIAQTAYAISGNRELMIKEGFNEYITKPIIKSVLMEIISRVVS